MAAIQNAERQEAEASAAADEAREDIQRADNYVLCVVLFAASLFFAGVSTRMPTTTGRAAILGLGCALFLATLAWIATFAVSLAI